MRSYPAPDRGDIRLHQVLFALSDPTRLAVVVQLDREGQTTVGDLLGGVVPKSTLSHHNKILREAGVTRTRSEGTRCRLSLRRTDLDALFPGLLDLVIAHSGKDSIAH